MLQRLLLEIFKNAKSVGLGADKRDPHRSATPGEHTAMRVNDMRQDRCDSNKSLTACKYLRWEEAKPNAADDRCDILFAHTVLNASF